MDAIRVSIGELMGGQEVLFGVPMGRQCLTRLLERSSEPSHPCLAVLDFGAISSATVSFLREGPLAYRQHLRSRSSTLYPVFANLKPPVADSLSDYLTASRDAVFACELNPESRIVNPMLLGQLEPKQKLTFDAVTASGAVTAAELAREGAGDEEVRVTAWNNRLAGLVQKGLVVETRQGRQKTFLSLFSGEGIQWV